MRLLHTSDWHLGQTLHGYERGYEHQCFLDWLLATLVAERVDALLIAGDVFDNANPSAASQKQWYRFLRQARQAMPRLDIVVIAGNHDSPGRLEAPGPLLEEHGTTIIGGVARAADGAIDLERLIVPLHDDAGAVRAWCLAIPFLRPGDVPRATTPAQAEASVGKSGVSSSDQSGVPTAEQTGELSSELSGERRNGESIKPLGDDFSDAYLAGTALLYRQAYALAATRCKAGQAIVAMGHCHMADGLASQDSERRIVIGGSEALPAAIFDPALAYCALGHLHLAQRVGRREHIRYSGSPLPLSFAEVGYQHQVLLVDLADGAARAVASVPVPRAVELLRVPPRPAPLAEVLAALAALDAPERPHCAQPFVEARVLLDAPEPGLRARVEAALAGKPLRLAKIEASRAVDPGADVSAALSLDQLAQIEPAEVFKRLYLQRYGVDAPDEQLSAFAELLLAAHEPDRA